MFTSNGDFIFPFDAILYWLKHVFIWSFQSGATNLDSIIRLPSRLIYIIIFQLFGNVGVSYFFLFTSFVIIFFAFYYFARNFLKIEKRSLLIILSLLFTFNPIFLGNLAKIGLVVAVAMLPLCLTFLHRTFVTQRFSYLILYLFALNISLVHPFTFTINFIVSFGYIIYLAKNNWQFVSTNILKFISIFSIAILINLYFILPLLSLGTIDKSALSQDISNTPIDYTSLVAIANTGDIFTALSLSKNVLIDFAFYNEKYSSIYFIATFLLYILLLSLYLFLHNKLKKAERRCFFLWMSAFLILTALSTATFFYTDILIKFLIGLPGGWMFRSPLKWQLYIPLTIVTLMALLMRHLKNKTQLLIINTSLIVVIVFTNAILASEIVTKLLIPRSIVYFAALQKIDMEKNNMLFIASDECSTFARENSQVMTELNQILISKDTQIKKISIKDADKINVNDYEYVFSCKVEPEKLKKYLTKFDHSKDFIRKTFRLYNNPKPNSHIYSTNKIYSLAEGKDINNKADLITQLYGEDFHFVNNVNKAEYSNQTVRLSDIFENITPESINNNTISSTISLDGKGKQELFIREQKERLYYKVNDNRIIFSPIPLKDFTLIKTQKGYGRVELENTKKNLVKIDYIDSRYDYTNLLKNPSLENGLWHKKVGDCNAYDNQPKIDMKLDLQEKTAGRQSLKLYAKRHIACTELLEKTKAEPGATYMFSFDYRGFEGYRGGYNINFGEDTFPVRETLIGSGNEWHTLNTKIEAPNNVSKLKINVYAFPDELADKPSTVNYDNFKLIKTPPLQGSFYMLAHSPQELQSPQKVNYKLIDPTKKDIQIKHATTPFYMIMKDSYHPKWQLLPKKERTSYIDELPWGVTNSISKKNHFNLNNSMNGWYIDPKLLCKQAGNSCVRNNDGSYNIQLVAEFSPQRWFSFGLIVSSAVIIGCVVFLLYDWRKHRSPKITLEKKSKL